MNAATEEITGYEEHDAADERKSPAPGVNIRGSHRVIDEIRGARTQDEPHRGAGGRGAAHESAHQRR